LPKCYITNPLKVQIVNKHTKTSEDKIKCPDTQTIANGTHINCIP